MPATVAVVGGGYGGIAAAKKLDPVANVVLIDTKDCFVHNVAALRCIVEPQWLDRMFFPYKNLLHHGEFVHDRVVSVDTTRVTLASGGHIDADYIILATGTSYPFPAKIDNLNSAVAKERVWRVHETVAQSQRVLLLGAGAVGLELCGEIIARWPDKQVAIVDHNHQILSGNYPPELRDPLLTQIKDLGTELLLGSTLAEPPPVASGVSQTFTVRTWNNARITADVWLQTHGATPATGYLRGPLPGTRNVSRSGVGVDPYLQVKGFPNVYAIGDIAASGDPKLAKIAREQGEYLGEELPKVFAGMSPEPWAPSPEFVSIPLGPFNGTTYIGGVGLLDAAETTKLKGRDLLVDVFGALFDAPD